MAAAIGPIVSAIAGKAGASLADKAGDAPGAILNAAGNAASAVANSGTKETTDTVTAKQGPAETGGQGVQATQQLDPSNQAANLGLTQAGDITKQIALPVTAQATQAAQAVQQSALGQAGISQATYAQAIQKTNQATVEVEKAIQDAASKAKIDPQGYLNSLGTDGKVLTSIGMVLSGIGAGLTGQPNMAMDLYQKNTDRAIQAQQKLYENLMTVAARKQDLLRTAQDQQIIASNAYNAAVISVMQGNNSAIQSVSEQAKAATQPQAAQQLINMNNQKYQQAIDAHNRDYINTIQSGDQRKVNLLGAIAAPVADHIAGTNMAPSNTSPIKRAIPATESEKPKSTVEKLFNDINSTRDIKKPNFLLNYDEVKSNK